MRPRTSRGILTVVVPLRSALVIDGAPAAVEGALWSAAVWSRAWSARGFAVATANPVATARPGQPTSDAPGSRSPADDRLQPGIVFTLTVKPGGTAAQFRVEPPGPGTADGDRGVASRLQCDDTPGSASRPGPTLVGITGPARGWTIRSGIGVTGAGCLVTIDARHAGRAKRPGLRRRVLRFEELLLGLVAMLAREAETRPVVVVAGVIISDGRVLAARRRYPPEAAGYWECPGGKVEPGETERAALARELREELGVDTEIGGRIGADIPIGTGLVLHAYLARDHRRITDCPRA